MRPPYDRRGRAAHPAASVDQGLRAFMLGVYNYMALGLAITGLVALGIYMLAVTGDASLAAKVARAGAQYRRRSAAACS